MPSQPNAIDSDSRKMLEELQATHLFRRLTSGFNTGVGIDIEAISRFSINLPRVFTVREIQYCEAQGAPLVSYAGRWCAKEAVVKAMGSEYRLSLRNVEIRAGSEGEPQVWLRMPKTHSNVSGESQPAAVEDFAWAANVHVSISHTSELAIAIATVSDVSSQECR